MDEGDRGHHQVALASMAAAGEAAVAGNAATSLAREAVQPVCAGPCGDEGKFRGPDPRAEGVPHTRVRFDDKGVTHYETYDYPEAGEGKRVDVVGPAHGGVPTPHTVDTKKHVNPRDPTKFSFTESRPRPALPEEVPERRP